MNEALTDILSFIFIAMGVCLFIALVGLAMIARRIRDLRVPYEADFFTTMHYIPLELVILLDLLDFGLDIFAAPIAWIVLDRLGLPNLRNKAALEAIIPVTGAIPTFTVAWFAARMLNLGTPPGSYAPPRSTRPALDEPQYRERGGRRSSAQIIDMDDY